MFLISGEQSSQKLLENLDEIWRGIECSKFEIEIYKKSFIFHTYRSNVTKNEGQIKYGIRLLFYSVHVDLKQKYISIIAGLNLYLYKQAIIFSKYPCPRFHCVLKVFSKRYKKYTSCLSVKC